MKVEYRFTMPEKDSGEKTTIDKDPITAWQDEKRALLARYMEIPPRYAPSLEAMGQEIIDMAEEVFGVEAQQVRGRSQALLDYYRGQTKPGGVLKPSVDIEGLVIHTDEHELEIAIDHPSGRKIITHVNPFFEIGGYSYSCFERIDDSTVELLGIGMEITLDRIAELSINPANSPQS